MFEALEKWLIFELCDSRWIEEIDGILLSLGEMVRAY